MSALTVTSHPAATRALELRESCTLDRPPSCIRFCHAHPEYIVVGTYELQKESQESAEGDGQVEDEEAQASAEDEDAPTRNQESTSAKAPQSRNGSLIVFRLVDSTLELVDTVSTPSAIFNLVFQPQIGRRDFLGAVTSTGSLIVARLKPDRDPARPLEILSISDIEGVGEGVLLTSLAWHPKKWNVAVITTSSGHVYLVSLDETTLSIKSSQQLPLMSQFESWCVAIWPPGVEINQEQHTIYTGADDGVLRYTTIAMLPDDPKLPEEDKALPSIKSGDAEEARDTPLWEQSYTEGPAAIARVRSSQHMVKNVHNAGITAILPLPAYDHTRAVIVTGSYDDHIRVLLVPHPHIASFCYTPQVLFEKSLGGGVWELHLFGFRRILPEEGGPATVADILVSCMQAGPRIVRLRMRGLDDVEMDVLHEFGGHELNYASHFRPSETGQLDIVTTSFYDKKLHLWAQTQTKSSSKDEKGSC